MRRTRAMAEGGPKTPTGALPESADRHELARFAALAEQWWDVDGPFRALHALNPVRIAFVRDRLSRLFGRPSRGVRPLAGLRLLDAGCGAGLASEPLARLGARVVGIDASPEAIAAARAHARATGLDIDYRVGGPETLAETGERFDGVIALEVIEHLPDWRAFLACLAGLVAKPGGLAAATLNRSFKSYLLGVVVAERLLRWLPPHTHDWRRFVRPAELVRALRHQGLEVEALAGMRYDVAAGRWRLAHRPEVNYIAFATRR